MRIISQNKRYDLPYEDCSIGVEYVSAHNYIIKAWRPSIFAMEMGLYRSEGEAIAVVEDCVTSHARGDPSFVFPDSET